MHFKEPVETPFEETPLKSVSGSVLGCIAGRSSPWTRACRG
jgi:hypothetical protein